MEEPIVISYCNSEIDNTHHGTQLFVNTLINNDWKYHIIGRGEKWNGFITRMIGYYNFLLTLDPKQIVVISDARDVYCVKNSKKFIKDFKKYNKKIVVSMELFAEAQFKYLPDKDYFQVTWIDKYWQMYNIDTSKIHRKYVNCGLISGYVEELIKFFKWAIDNKYTDDQKALGAYINTVPELVYADIHAELLHTTGAFVSGGLYDVTIQSMDSPTFSELAGLTSYFLHIPGTNLRGQKYLYENVETTLTFLNSKKLPEIYPEHKEHY
jgi:hypothetical protein